MQNSWIRMGSRFCRVPHSRIFAFFLSLLTVCSARGLWEEAPPGSVWSRLGLAFQACLSVQFPKCFQSQDNVQQTLHSIKQRERYCEKSSSFINCSNRATLSHVCLKLLHEYYRTFVMLGLSLCLSHSQYLSSSFFTSLSLSFFVSLSLFLLLIIIHHQWGNCKLDFVLLSHSFHLYLVKNLDFLLNVPHTMNWIDLTPVCHFNKKIHK